MKYIFPFFAVCAWAVEKRGDPMSMWALGYAGKTGMKFVVQAEDGTRITSTIGAVAHGNMHAPNPDDLREKIVAKLEEGDVVLSPSGPNYTYLAALATTGAKVYWIHPGSPALADVAGSKVSKRLLEVFAENPEAFYEYRPEDAKVAALRMRTLSWIGVMRDRVAAGNAHSQMMRREYDFVRLHGLPNRATWVSDWVAREKRNTTRRLRGDSSTGDGADKQQVVLGAEQLAQLEAGLRGQAERLYEGYYDPKGEVKPKDRDRARAEITARRLDLLGLTGEEDRLEAEVEDMLAVMPENALFEGIVGKGALKTRAQVLAYMRNPLFYPCFAALCGYAGLGVTDGQANQRRVGQADRGHREFKRALVFDFADRYWQCDPIGFVKALYYAYKRHQYLAYWEFMVLTQDVFQALKMGKDTEAEDAGEHRAKKEASDDDINALVARFAALKDARYDMIVRSRPAMKAIDALVAEPDPAERRVKLRQIVSRRPGCLNVQMTPARIEQQIKRLLGVTLLATVYYRWLTLVGQPLPLDQDYIYLRRWRKVTSAASDAVPTEFDHLIALQYYQQVGDELLARRMEEGRELPALVMWKLAPPDERGPQPVEAGESVVDPEAGVEGEVEAGVEVGPAEDSDPE